MPIEEGDQYTYEQLSNLRKRNVCAICGERLDLYQDFHNHKAFLACKDWGRTHHEGIERESSRWEKEGLASLNIKTRSEIMEKEHGTGMTTAMEKAKLPMTGALTKLQAMDILKLVYPRVPEEQILRTAILCRDFGLHPLMKEVYIIPFGQGDKRVWSTVLGIGATRKMVARQGTYSYRDNTPRVMTEKEQKDIFGEVDAFNIVAITKLRTRNGEEAQGYGRWPKELDPQGVEKGNTKSNMAFIRSERNAFGRLFTDVLPQGIEVIDETYADVPDVGKVIVATGEIIEDEAGEQSTQPKPGHWCFEHDCEFEAQTGRYGPFWGHKTDDPKYPKGWCNEKKQKTKEPKELDQLAKAEAEAFAKVAEAVEDEKALELAREPNTIEVLKETMDLCNWSAMAVGAFCNSDKSWGIKEYSDLTTDQLTELIAHIKKNPR